MNVNYLNNYFSGICKFSGKVLGASIGNLKYYVIDESDNIRGSPTTQTHIPHVPRELVCLSERGKLGHLLFLFPFKASCLKARYLKII